MTDTKTEAVQQRIRCFKYGCRRKASTVELETGPGSASGPNALCLVHAMRPAQRGTFEKPVIVTVHGGYSR
jgi:hypothetical protein